MDAECISMLALPCMRLWEGPLRPATVAFALVLAVLAWGDSALLALPFKLRLPSGGLDGRPGSLGRPSSDMPSSGVGCTLLAPAAGGGDRVLRSAKEAAREAPPNALDTPPCTLFPGAVRPGPSTVGPPPLPGRPTRDGKPRECSRAAPRLTLPRTGPGPEPSRSARMRLVSSALPVEALPRSAARDREGDRLAGSWERNRSMRPPSLDMYTRLAEPWVDMSNGWKDPHRVVDKSEQGRKNFENE